MSAFLGHIHYWLYRKIQLLVERENLILEKTSKVVDDLAEELALHLRRYIRRAN